MKASPVEKYRARVDELESLKAQLEQPSRDAELGPMVGRMLEAAGDLLRRRSAVPTAAELIDGSLAAIPDRGLQSWAGGVNVDELLAKLKRAASQAVEAAIPDSSDDAEALRNFSLQDVMARDRFESALVALEALGGRGRDDAKGLAQRLRDAIARCDSAGRRGVASFTALNEQRRQEGQLLDGAHRQRAWWLTERSGLEDDLLVHVLGGEAKGSLAPAEKAAHDTVTTRRTRRISEEELFRFDLGLAAPGEVTALKAAAEHDAELKLTLAALEAGEQAIEELTKDEAPILKSEPASHPVERLSQLKPDVIEDRGEFKVLVFRTKTVQVVVQPRRPDRFAAAAVYAPDAPDKAVAAESSAMGLSFDLGAPERLAGKRARVIVRLTDGQTIAMELGL